MAKKGSAKETEKQPEKEYGSGTSCWSNKDCRKKKAPMLIKLGIVCLIAAVVLNIVEYAAVWAGWWGTLDDPFGFAWASFGIAGVLSVISYVLYSVGGILILMWILIRFGVW